MNRYGLHWLRNRLYYRLKPFIPAPIRIALRKQHALRIRDRASLAWPITPSAAEPPEGWPGWPEGKRFAFVLTHDVESNRGLGRVKQLAEMEREFGFRSSFNFIPEGGYETPKELRIWLAAQGFEVGVHDLNHDGRLYESEESFTRKARRINDCLRDWNAVGFRSGFMMHHLDWIHQLDITYDASTFDIDPFEPEPYGVNTIFPFWVGAPHSTSESLLMAAASGKYKENVDFRSRPAEGGGGYMELPYTLPQDSTLFLFLGERTIDVWKQKLDWIVKHGGMALLNVHPDYVGVDNSGVSDEYPAFLYRDFLQYVKTRYFDDCWNVLPKKVASYCRDFRPTRATRTPKNIGMLAYTDYSSDARVVRYAETLAKRGDQVDVVACGQRSGESNQETIREVNIYKLCRRTQNHQTGPVAHLWPLLVFFIKATTFITRRHLHKPYDLIHVHNIPEWLVFAAAIPRLFGCRIILDVHDLVPELFEAKFKASSGAFVGAALRAVERISCDYADHVIISNHLWKDRIVKRSVAAPRCSVFFNNIDPELFRPHRRTRFDDRKIVLFPGTLQWHQGVDIAIRAFSYVVEHVPTAEFHIYGGRGVVDELKALVDQLGLQSRVLFFDPVPVREIPQLIANADLGVVPKRADSFGNEAYSTKIMEFMSQGVPVVISRTAVDSYYFNDDQVRFCESGNVQEFGQAIVEVLSDEELRARLIGQACDYVTRNHWGNRSEEYLDLVDGIIGGRDYLARSHDASFVPLAPWVVVNGAN